VTFFKHAPTIPPPPAVLINLAKIPAARKFSFEIRCRCRTILPKLAAPLTRWKRALRVEGSVEIYAKIEKMVVAHPLFNMRQSVGVIIPCGGNNC